MRIAVIESAHLIRFFRPGVTTRVLWGERVVVGMVVQVGYVSTRFGVAANGAVKFFILRWIMHSHTWSVPLILVWMGTSAESDNGGGGGERFFFFHYAASW